MKEGQMNKVNKRYNKKVKIPISVILETIFSDDNHDVETICRWAKHYGFIELEKNENDKLGYYKLQDDYTKQSFYIWLSKEERKQYDYENYLIDKNEILQNRINKAIEYIENHTIIGNASYGKTYVYKTINKILDILKGEGENENKL